MKRRRRLAVTLFALAMQALAPIGAYAARPAALASDFCSAAPPDTHLGDGAVAPPRGADSGVPAPRPTHSPHSHCPSCLGTPIAAAIPPVAIPFVVRPRSFDRVTCEQVRADIAAQPALLPPLRGPPSFTS